MRKQASGYLEGCSGWTSHRCKCLRQQGAWSSENDKEGHIQPWRSSQERCETPVYSCTMHTAPTQASELRLKSSLCIPLAMHPSLRLLLSRTKGTCVSFISRSRESGGGLGGGLGSGSTKPLTSALSEKGRHWRVVFFLNQRCTNYQFIALSTLAYIVLSWLSMYFILRIKIPLPIGQK